MKNIFSLLILFSLLNSFILPQNNWQVIPSGTTASLQAVHFCNLSTGFIVGDLGTILKTTDAGLSWQDISYSVPTLLYDVYAFNQDNIIVVGSGGLILKSTNGGLNWNSIPGNVTDELYSVTFNGNIGICGGGSQTILNSTDSGSSWNIIQTGFFGGSFRGTCMITSQTGLIAGENSIFQPMFGKSTDSGMNWDFTPFYLNTNEGRANSIEFTDINTGIITSSVWDGTGAISKTTDGGSNWVTTLMSQPINDVHFPISNSSLRGYAVGDAGTILLTWDAGSTWNESISGTSERLNGVYFIDLELGIVVGEQGVILRTTDGGLPVELVSFTGNAVNNNVILNWITATEINNRGFEIEKLLSDAWETIGFINGSGTTIEPKTYSFNDNGMVPGIYEYRLKQLDFNGSYTYSDRIRVEVLPVSKFSLEQNYPNPFNPGTMISWQTPSAGWQTIKLFNTLGEEIETIVNEYSEAGYHSKLYNANSGLSGGVYFYQLKAGDYADTKKMILMK